MSSRRGGPDLAPVRIVRGGAGGLCPYPTHRGSEWTNAGGRLVCGICHPPASPLVLELVARSLDGATHPTERRPRQ